jgi:hypothetical protein
LPMHSGIHVSWRSGRLLTAIFLIFLSGALVGVLASRFGMRASQDPPASYYTIDGQKIAVGQLAKELDLTPVQTQQLTTILDDFVMYVQMLQSQMDDVRANGKARILSILDEKQKSKFEKMMSNMQARRQ